MRLHIGERAAEQAGDALDGEPLGHIDELAAAVIALARQAFGVFVGEHRALRLEHGAADDVFRRDQLDLVALAAELELDRLGDFGIGFGERGGEKPFVRGFCFLTDSTFRLNALYASSRSGLFRPPLNTPRPPIIPAEPRKGLGYLCG